MEWEEFVYHPTIVSDTANHPNQSPGEYLYKKLLHDMLECLNGYKGFVEIIQLDQNASYEAQRWFLKWESSVTTWILSLTNLSKQCYAEKPQYDDNEWPILIAKLTKIPDRVDLMQSESQILPMPYQRTSQNLVEKARVNILRLKNICHYIQNQEYIRLWMSEYDNL